MKGDMKPSCVVTSTRAGMVGMLLLLLMFAITTLPARAQTVFLGVTAQSFNPTFIGTSASSLVGVTTTGTAALTFTSIASSGASFSQTNTCGTSLAPGGHCIITAIFAPVALGAQTGSITLTDNATNSPQTITLRGSGLPPTYASVASVTFAKQGLNSPSAATVVTLTNVVTTATGITLATTGDFAQTSNCPASMPGSSTCTVNLTFTPTATGVRTGALTVTTSVGYTFSVTLSGTGIVPYAVTPTTLAFGNQSTGTTSAAKTVTVTNYQSAPLAISGVGISAGFAQTNNCASVPASSACSFSVSFAPTATGTVAGSLTFAPSAGASPQTISLSGTGTVPYTVTPTTLAFGNVGIGATSSKTVTVTNYQNAPLGISSVAVSPGFTQVNNCSSVPANSSCSFSVSFAPSATGAATGSLTFMPGSGAGQSIALSGTGIVPVTVTQAAIIFSPQPEGTNLGSQKVAFRLYNNQSVALGITGITASANFQQTNTCGSSVPAGGSCVITAGFAPVAAGVLTGTLTVNDDAPGSPQTVVTLQGTGLLPMALSTASVTFAAQAAGGTSAAQSVLVINLATLGFDLNGITVSGDFQQTNNCPATLAAGLTCTVSVVFAPTTTGVRSGTLTVNNSSLRSPITATLAGTGTKATTTLTGITISTNAGYDINSPPPRNHAISLGLTAQYTAMGNYSDGTTKDITSSVTWASSDPTVAAISNTAPSQGFVTTVKAGGVYITATSGSIQASSMLEIFAAAVTSAVISPTSPTIAYPGTQQFTLTATYSDGTTNSSPAVTWSATGGVTISNTGLATATAPGSGTVTGYVWNCAPSGCGPVGQTVNVSITGPAIVATPVSMDFGLQHKGTSVTQNVTLKNVSNGTVSFQATAPDGFQTGNPCLNQIPANSTCLLSVTFAPASGTSGNVQYGGSLSVTSSSGTATVPLTGVGTDSTPPCPTPSVDMKLLVISKGQTEVELGGIKQILDYTGVPYTIFDFQAQPGGITPDMLSDGSCHGYYQGVIFTLGDYIYSLPGMSALTTYEQNFAVRQVNWYTYPTGDFGFNTATAGTSDTQTPNFTAAGATVFSYANTANPLTISSTWAYLATPATPPAGTTVTPLLMDNAGNAFSLIYDFGDGRQYLTEAFDTNAHYTHGLVVAYGLVNWVTKGIFLGEYHVYAVPQVDDIFMHNDEWDSATPCPNTNSLPQFRLSASDWDNVVAWQGTKQSNAQFPSWTIQMAFVGSGATGDPSQGYGVNPDPLTPEVELYKSSFNWLSHTWDHTLLDNATAALTDTELLQNNAMAGILGLPNYNPVLLVTPAITGLNNPAFINEAVADGVRVIVSDTTVLNTPNNGPNPTPNVGIVNSYNSNLYEVPRHATNLFYNISTPDDWAAEYHCIYNFAPYNTYTYQQIVSDVSSTLLSDMLEGDMDPQMYHMSNLHNYDGAGHTLLTDVYDQTFNTYLGLYKLPVLSPTLDVLAQNMQNRNAYNLSGVTASLTMGSTPSVSITVPAGSAVPSATVPVTGLNSTGAELYGGTYISHPVVNAGQTVTLPVQ